MIVTNVNISKGKKKTTNNLSKSTTQTTHGDMSAYACLQLVPASIE